MKKRVVYIDTIEELKNKGNRIEIIAKHNGVEIDKSTYLHGIIKTIKHDIALWQGLTKEEEYQLEFTTEDNDFYYIYSVDYSEVLKWS